MYAIPKAGYWTIVLNTDLNLWSLKEDIEKDFVRVDMPVAYYNSEQEYFTMVTIQPPKLAISNKASKVF